MLKFLDFEYNFTHLEGIDEIKFSYDYIFVDMQVDNNGGPSIIRELKRIIVTLKEGNTIDMSGKV